MGVYSAVYTACNMMLTRDASTYSQPPEDWGVQNQPSTHPVLQATGALAGTTNWVRGGGGSNGRRGQTTNHRKGIGCKGEVFKAAVYSYVSMCECKCGEGKGGRRGQEGLLGPPVWSCPSHNALTL